jgi:cobalt-zinc-cadmium efflux system membrane fusion protein
MTRTDRGNTFRQLGSWIPNAAVLCALAGVGYWGHVYHWQIPKYSELEEHASPATDPAPAREAASAERGASAAAATPTAAPGSRKERSNFQPVVQFPSPAAVHNARLEIGAVKPRPMDQFVTANGIVTYNQSRVAQLSARAPGVVWRVEKRLGETVHKGDVLALIDSIDVGRAKAELLHSIVLHDHKAHILQLENQQKLQGVVSERDRREAESAFREARIRRHNAQQALLNLGLPIEIEGLAGLSDDELAKRTHFLGLPESIVATLDPRSTTGNLIPIVAPFDGVVIGREIVSGEIVEPNQPQFVIADVRRMWIQLDVLKEDAMRLAPGQEMRFTVDGMPIEVETHVTWISTEVDEKTRTVQVRAEAENPLLDQHANSDDGQRLLRANAFGTGRLRIRSEPQALTVPNAALQRLDSNNVVFVPRPDGRSFEARPVRVGIVGDGFVEIAEGLDAGEPVVVSGSSLLKSEALRIRLAEGGAESSSAAALSQSTVVESEPAAGL